MIINSPAFPVLFNIVLQKFCGCQLKLREKTFGEIGVGAEANHIADFGNVVFLLYQQSGSSF